LVSMAVNPSTDYSQATARYGSSPSTGFSVSGRGTSTGYVIFIVF
jgi:hypothetical protein